MIRFRRAVCMICILTLLTITAVSEIMWPGDQQALAGYTERVNNTLLSCGEHPINSLISSYPSIAVLAITDQDNAEIPEGVEIDVSLSGGSITQLVLRVSDPRRFASIAAACVQAVSPDVITFTNARKDADVYAAKAQKDPQKSFEDLVDTTPGLNPRVYYAYYPNQYHDGVSWLQMTLIFPLAGA